MDVIVERCAGLDVHKKTVMATVRFPDGQGGSAASQSRNATNRCVKVPNRLVPEPGHPATPANLPKPPRG